MLTFKENTQPVTLSDVKTLPFRDLWKCADAETKETLKQRAIEKLKTLDWSKFDYPALCETLEFHLGEEYANYALEDVNILAENVLENIK